MSVILLHLATIEMAQGSTPSLRKIPQKQSDVRSYGDNKDAIRPERDVLCWRGVIPKDQTTIVRWWGVMI
jgi:hypothetical protein